ncbi:mitochondrial Rho GTPase [Trichodelitschia bisporula]|uniref:Mitochondrial Rho GTPase n=1 Tax=Trichodelitschia bisporula TaxID=703511 RepID=A0A6G1HLM3_9PEZI|nr:mitochondrial Rho GTPase [Trichodelitschia bisporula]
MATVRVCVCGDDGTGKSSLITGLVKDVFITTKIQPKLPTITLPATLGTPDNVTTTIADTSALPQDRDALRKELRKANVILLVYSDHYSYERVGLFWMPFFRSLGVNVPVVLCANKSDASTAADTDSVIDDEMLPLMNEWKEIDTCIRTSAKEHRNVNEAFYLCQKAVTHPISPLYDAKEAALKPAAVAALQRIFYLCDRDRDGVLDDTELLALQQRTFGRTLDTSETSAIKSAIRGLDPAGATDAGITALGFLLLNKNFAETGRHETIWALLRSFHYTDSLSLKPTFLHPKYDVPAHSTTELSPAGYRFFLDLFQRHDRDSDGVLNDTELATLFAPTPGLPPEWVDSSFPSTTVHNEAGYVTLQGWLAQWSMTTFTTPHTTLEYLAYLGFEPSPTAALRTTRPHRPSPKPAPRTDRHVFSAYVLGAPGSGKSALLDAFLARPHRTTYSPTIKPRAAVNAVELRGGRQAYLILHEPGSEEPAILAHTQRITAADLLCFCYDSSDPSSWSRILDLRSRYPALASCPAVFVATKADADKAMQRAEMQPDEWAQGEGYAVPMHVSARWGSIGEVFVHLAECAMFPAQARPKGEGEEREGLGGWIALGAVVCAGAAAAVVWRRALGG